MRSLIPNMLVVGLSNESSPPSRLDSFLCLPELLVKASLYTTCGKCFHFPHGLPGILIKKRSDDRKF